MVFLLFLGAGLTGFCQERRVIEVGTVPGKMRFAPEWLLVQPGEALTIRLNNTCHMQHNFVLCRPGKEVAMKVAQAAWALGASAVEKEWVPELPLVLKASPLVNPGEAKSFEMVAPAEKGDYPYVCTLPGHAIVMRGILRVGDPGERPPAVGEQVEIIPESAVERAAQKMKRYRRFMDGGPTVGGVIMPGTAVNPKTGKGLPTTVNKGVVVKVGDNGEGAILFDTELMNYAAGWTGGFVDFIKGREDERSEYRYEVGGDLHFVQTLKVDWADRTGRYDDPRERRLGSLDSNWLDYGGLYHHGARIVFRYRVHGREVLDSPSIEDGNRFVRTLKVGPGEAPLSLRAFGGEEVVFSARSDAVSLQIVFEEGQASIRRSGVFPDLTRWTVGGPPKWEAEIETRGVRGSGDGAYVVDTLTLPYENPWNALFYTSGVDFFSNGDAALCTSHGDVWTVKGIDRRLKKLVWKRMATGLANPLGLKIVNDVVHVVDLHQITRLHDLNGDGEADYYECFNNDCEVSDIHHRFTNDLQTDTAGNFYYLKCTDEGRSSHAGSVIRVSPDGKQFALHATGLRNPNGMAIGPGDVITFGKQQGGWIPSSGLHVVKEGAFYGYLPSHHREVPPTEFEQPFCWIPHGVDNSCGGQVWVPEGDRWGPLGGRLLHFSYGKCQMFLVLMEEFDDRFQGGVVQFPEVEFESGSMRARFRSEDGQLYVTGLRGWQTTAAMPGCLQRVRYNGKKVHLPVGVEVEAEGVRLRFLEPLDPKRAVELSNFELVQWDYRWTKNYGSPDFRPSSPEEKGRDTVEVTGAVLAKDRRSVLIQFAEVKPVMQMMIRYDLSSARGHPMKGEVFHTIHVVPGEEESN